MVRLWHWAMLAGLVLFSAGPVQAAGLRFHWQTGQVLNYKVEQVTSASELVDGKKVETGSKLNNVKHWQVLAVDAAGVATMQLSLTTLRVETTTPTGEVLIFDSADPSSSNAEMSQQLTQFVGQTLAILRVDDRGQVIEVKESKHGPASRFESEPPFAVTFPETAVEAGQGWERVYKITLEPPQGTGEKYEAVQKFTSQTAADSSATITFSTAIRTLPESLLDQAPLLQMQPEGEVVFDSRAGRMTRATLHVDKELKNHQGEGSSYSYKSTYSEQYLGDK